MKNLHFQHTFSNGIMVNLSAGRTKDGRLVLTADKANFQNGIEDEYDEWLKVIAATIFQEANPTEQAQDFMEGLQRIAGYEN